MPCTLLHRKRMALYAMPFLYSTRLSASPGIQVVYKDVISNLNILDYDYYFKITDEILQGNIAATLMTFNELLSEGFDGHHFINGLNSHFRDLLVCKDEITLQLLEVSPNIRGKYKLQAQSISVALLLSFLEIGNKCDVEYRSARNQRLQVELALLKMCSKNDNPAGPAAEKPAGQKESPALSPAKPAAKEGTEEKKSPEIKQAVAHGEKKTITQPTTDSDKKIIAAEKSTDYPEFKKSPPSSSSKIPSIRSTIQQNGKQDAPTDEFTLEIAENNLSQPIVVTEDEIQAAWVEFTYKMQLLGKKSLFTALSMRKPALLENNLIWFEVENSVQDSEIKEIKVELLSFFRSKFNGTHFQLETRVIETDGDCRRLIPLRKNSKR